MGNRWKLQSRIFVAMGCAARSNAANPSLLIFSFLALFVMPSGVLSGKGAISSSAVAVGYFSLSTASSSFVHLIVGWSSPLAGIYGEVAGLLGKVHVPTA